MLLLTGAGARASEQSVDRETKEALALDAHPSAGAARFAESCARCHGAHAQGDAPKAIPALAGQRFSYLVRQLANFSGGERDSAPMHRALADPELRTPQTWVDIAAYLSELPIIPKAMTGDGAHVALGRGIFHEQCASCHGADARGDKAGFVPSLRRQHYSYLVRQMERLAEGARHNVDENLQRFLKSFDAEEIDAVADYLSRLQGPGKDRKTMLRDGTVVD
jgi:cytochrome c553